MHATAIIQWLLDCDCNSIHLKRRKSLADVVGAAVQGGLGVVRMAKKLVSKAGLRHRIKMCDRLLSNPNLQNETTDIYRTIARRLIGAKRRIQIAVDWSEIRSDSSIHLLRAATIINGRAFTVYEQLYPQAMLGSPKAHRQFMIALRCILPPDCKAIIITDAGFKSPWFRLLSELGFAWVGRIRSNDSLRAHRGTVWAGCKTLYSQARAQARDLGMHFYTRKTPTACRVVLYKALPKGRHCLTRSGKPAANRRSKKNSRSQVEPWLLVACPTLAQLSATAIVSLYAGRMQIEQTFRDTKNDQWGMGLRRSQTRSIPRLTILLLVAAMGSYALWLIGLAARATGYDICYGNRSKREQTLSTLSLAMHWIEDPNRPRIHRSRINDALRQLTQMVRTYEI
jgi:hypothetical protein